MIFKSRVCGSVANVQACGAAMEKAVEPKTELLKEAIC